MINIAIIPARGGSKRIPKKNIKEFFGKPIIAYSIEAALKSNLFDEIMVSTDDQEIAEVAIKYGANVPFMRTEDNADDYSSTVDVLLEVIDCYTKSGFFFSTACCIYPTAPFVTPEKLKQGFDKLKLEKLFSVFPVVPFNYPVWRGLKKEKNDKVIMLWPEHLNSRSQDLEEIYHDAGQWYWFEIESVKAYKKLFNENTASIVLNPLEVQDIDNLSDWHIAELKYGYLQSLK